MHRPRLVVVVQLLALAGATALSGACDNSPSGPNNAGPLDTLAIRTADTQVEQIVLQPAVLSLLAGGNIAAAAPAPTRLFAGAHALASLGTSALRLHASRTAPSSSMRAARAAILPGDRRDYTYSGQIIPDSVRGRTFVMTQGTFGPAWTIDSAATGAPANGVRFVLMQFDTLSGSYSNSTVVGSLDVAEESADPKNRFVFTAKDTNDATVFVGTLDISGASSIERDTLMTTLSKPNGPSMTSEVDAVIDNSGTGRLDLHMAATLSTGALTLDLVDPEGDVHAGDVYTLDTHLGTSDVKFVQNVIQSSGQYVYSDTTTIKLNGATFGYIMSSYGGATWLYANRQPMSDPDLATLNQYLTMVNDTFSGIIAGHDVIFAWVLAVSHQ